MPPARPIPLCLDLDAARAAGHADLVAPPMFAVVYGMPALAPAMFDPEVGIDFARLVHGGQEFTWGELVVAGDEITTTCTLTEVSERGGNGFYTFATRSTQPARRRGLRRHLEQHRARSLMEVETLTVTPDRYLTVRYAGASGDFNPIHIDEEFARSVGLPGRILHGLWMMAQAARAQTAAAGGPASLKRLSVQFRGMGVPEAELTVTSTVRDEADGIAHVDIVVEQNGRAIIRNADADVAVGGGG